MSGEKKIVPSAKVVGGGIFDLAEFAGMGDFPTRDELLDIRRKMIAGIRGLDKMLGTETVLKTRRIRRGGDSDQ